MSVRTEDEIRQLAQAIGGQDLADMVEKKIDGGDLRGARIIMLGWLDQRVMGNTPPPAEEAANWYAQLGFTLEERLRFRQNNIKS